jgi:hypothetical protein
MKCPCCKKEADWDENYGIYRCLNCRTGRGFTDMLFSEELAKQLTFEFKCWKHDPQVFRHEGS